MPPASEGLVVCPRMPKCLRGSTTVAVARFAAAAAVVVAAAAVAAVAVAAVVVAAVVIVLVSRHGLLVPDCR